MSRLGVQSQTQGMYHLEDCVEIWTALTRERLVKTFARQAGITSHLPHAPGTCNIAQRLGDERCVTLCLIKASLQICRHFLRRAKVFGDIVASSLGLAHHALLKVAREAQCCLDVGRLRALVTAGQQNHHFAPVSCELHPVTGSIIDPQFGDALANRLDIPGVTGGEALDPDLNPCPRTNVAQLVKPLGESLGLAKLSHVTM